MTKSYSSKYARARITFLYTFTVKDFLTISHNMEEPDYVANIYISDLKGRMVRYLIKNNLLGTKGSFNWDGVDDTCKPLAQVSYYLN